MKRTKIWMALGLGLASGGLAWWAGESGALDRLESATWSPRVKIFARPGAATDRIKIILLDQYSLDFAREQQWSVSWPWPRELYAPILAFCRRAGARSVAFDVLFTEPSVHGVEDDARLGEAVAQSAPFVAAAYAADQTTGRTRWPDGVPVPPSAAAETLTPPPRAATALTPPIPEVAGRAVRLGNVSETPDADGVIRRVSLLSLFDGRPIFSLGAAAQQAAAGPDGAPYVSARRGWRVGDRVVPLDRAGRAILRYRGELGAYRIFNAAEIIQSELRLQEDGGAPPPVDPAELRDAYVFFGYSAPGLLDLRPTPISRVYPGVGIHATALDNLLSGDFIAEPSARTVAAALLLLGLAGAGLMLFARGAAASVVLFAAGLLLPPAGALAAYAAGWWWPLAATWAAALPALLGAIIYNYATEGRQKAFIKQAFRHYLSPAVIDQIIADPSQLRLGGERRELTIFFSDLQGFSSLSEKLDPTELTRLLNDYLTDMTDIVLAEGGTLDKYEGDAIIAFWNAPLRQADHAVRAVRAARRCQAQLAARRAEFKERSGVELFMRIGINTGPVVVGNMGSRDRFDYTVLGDAANLASRLEGANKAFGTYTMISESAWQQTGGQFPGRELARLRVVGRRTPVRVYEPAPADSPPPAWRDFDRAREAFYAGNLDAAAAAFAPLAEHDPAAAAYLARCESLRRENTPPEDGVWTLTAK